MKQILIIGAGHRLPMGPFAFLRAIRESERVHVKGLFFRPVDYPAMAAAGASNNIVPLMELEDNEKEVIDDSEWDKNLFIKESRYADLILISGQHFYGETDKGQPNEYLWEALQKAECPVLVVPENFKTIEHLFMAYDGSRESIYAIKQFCNLFPALIDLPTEILYIHEDAGDTIPDLDNLQQFTRLKFDSMSFSKLRFNASEYFSTWISGKKNVLLVSGSFGRSTLSYIGKRSFAEDVIRDHQLPVFIAHR